VQTVDPRTIRPTEGVGRPSPPEMAAQPVPLLTTILFVAAVIVLAVVAILLATRAPAPAEIHDSWMNLPAYQAHYAIHDSWIEPSVEDRNEAA